MAESDEILREVIETKTKVDRLWDEDDPGSITSLHNKLDRLNGRVRGNEVRSKVNQAIISAVGGGGGVAALVTKIMNMW